jgi:hypothetical protein
MTSARWRKSSHSGDSGSCVEVAQWRKSSYSGNSGNCAEVAVTELQVGVRDSKNPAPTLAFETVAWAAFLHTVRP